MNNKITALFAASFNTLYRTSQKQFSESNGLRLNSKDWKPYIKLGSAVFYNFLINGIVKTKTTTTVNNNKYEQILQFDEYKGMENALLLLYLNNTPDSTIIQFIYTYLYNTRIKVFCTCPAFKFWGYEYILTKKKSVFGPGEVREPDVRNPNRIGCYCKHLWVICDGLEKKKEMFARGLAPFYKKVWNINMFLLKHMVVVCYM